MTSRYLLIFFLAFLLLLFVFSGQFAFCVDQVEDHEEDHPDDDDVLALPGDIGGHPGVETRLDLLNLLPQTVK